MKPQGKSLTSWKSTNRIRIDQLWWNVNPVWHYSNNLYVEGYSKEQTLVYRHTSVLLLNEEAPSGEDGRCGCYWTSLKDGPRQKKKCKRTRSFRLVAYNIG